MGQGQARLVVAKRRSHFGRAPVLHQNLQVGRRGEHEQIRLDVRRLVGPHQGHRQVKRPELALEGGFASRQEHQHGPGNVSRGPGDSGQPKKSTLSP